MLMPSAVRNCDKRADPDGLAASAVQLFFLAFTLKLLDMYHYNGDAWCRLQASTVECDRH